MASMLDLSIYCFSVLRLSHDPCRIFLWTAIAILHQLVLIRLDFRHILHLTLPSQFALLL